MSWGAIYKYTPFGKLNNPNGFGEVYKDINPDETTEENDSQSN